MRVNPFKLSLSSVVYEGLTLLYLLHISDKG